MISKDQIKAARAMLGITQAELAAKANISLATLNNIERGANYDPRVSTIRKIRHALELAGVVFSDSADSQGLHLMRREEGA